MEIQQGPREVQRLSKGCRACLRVAPLTRAFPKKQEDLIPSPWGGEFQKDPCSCLNET